jgi:cold shock CspA family protein
MSDADQRLLRIGVFYDGNFFFHVSNYYRYVHARQKRISIPGLHEFIRHHVAEAEGVDVRYCHIVDAHFFRGRFWAKEAEARQKLYNERVFDDILMAEGVVTHYLPMRQGHEKGIDVWLSLEAFELAVYKRFNLLVMIAGDSDFIPLARKINSLGTRVMVLGWDFEYKDDSGRDRQTVTSIHLLDEVTYPVMMNQIIDDKTRREDLLIKNLFVEQKRDEVPTPHEPFAAPLPTFRPQEATIPQQQASAACQASVACDATSATTSQSIGERHSGEIFALKEGFGFIKCAKCRDNVFFHWSALVNLDFGTLQKGQKVNFVIEQGDKGLFAKDIEVIE